MKKRLLLVMALTAVVFCFSGCEPSDFSSAMDSVESRAQIDTNTTTSKVTNSNDSYLASRKAETVAPNIVTTKPATSLKPPVSTSRASNPAPSTTTIVTAPTNTDFISQVVALVNVERKKAGLAPVSASSSLNSAAAIRAKEIITKFAHTRPDGTSCFTVLAQLNISYKTCGENIAAGQTTPAEVMNGWMNSEGHRANILNPSFRKLGVGYVQGGSYKHNWVQLFTD